MEKWLKEIERVKQEKDAFLDRRCIGINSVTVMFLDTKQEYNLSENYFADRHSVVDPCFAGAYITPGVITTMREIHIHAVKCDAISHLLDDYIRYGYYISNSNKEYYEQLVPGFLKEI